MMKVGSYFIAWTTHLFFCASIGARLAFGNKSRYSFSVSFKFFIALIISRIRTWLVLPVMCSLIFSDLSFFHVVETLLTLALHFSHWIRYCLRIQHNYLNKYRILLSDDFA